MPSAIIVDDVEKARTTLRRDLEEYCPDVKVLGEAGGVREAMALLKKCDPDIVFLDIQMQDGDGFDVLEQTSEKNFKVIFTTASDAHAIKAFKFSAVDYLLKPVDPEELQKAVRKVKDQGNKSDSSMQLLAEALKNIKKKHTRIAIHTSEKVHMLELDDIIRIEADGNYSRFFLTGGKSHLVTKTLKEYDDLLSDSGFFRVHQSHLVNTRHIKEFIKADGGYLLMTDKSHVSVSTRKKAEVMEMLEQL
ncbi:MAG: response regulator transcription factor [Bacteroidia bacterium]|nr:response regulator transcription factor [Bacteroidia bacterium]